MPDHLGDDMRRVRHDSNKEEKEIKSKSVAWIVIVFNFKEISLFL